MSGAVEKTRQRSAGEFAFVGMSGKPFLRACWVEGVEI